MNPSRTPDVHLAEVTARNWRDVADLSPRRDQERFVAPVTRYLCLCHYGDDWNPVAILEGDATVGFAMWAVDTDESRWIGGLVIDATAQGRGVGTAAVSVLIDELRAQDGCTGIALSYEPENNRARDLYARLGFVETGEVDGDEVIARLEF